MRGHGTRSHGGRVSSARYFLDDLRKEAGVNILLALGFARTQRAVTNAATIRKADASTLDFAAHDIPTGVQAFAAGAETWMPTWYDTSGLGNHAVQATAGNQPRVTGATGAYLGGAEFAAASVMNGTAGMNFGLSDFCLLGCMKIANLGPPSLGHPILVTHSAGNSRCISLINTVGFPLTLAVTSNGTVIGDVFATTKPVPENVFFRFVWTYTKATRVQVFRFVSSSVSGNGNHTLAAAFETIDIGNANANTYQILPNATTLGTLHTLIAMTGIPSQAAIDRFLNLPLPA